MTRYSRFDEFIGCHEPGADTRARNDLERSDGVGYDIRSFEPSGSEKLIEVKTTNGGAKTPFFLTRTEYEVAEERKDSGHLYRLHRFAQAPQIFTVKPQLADAL